MYTIVPSNPHHKAIANENTITSLNEISPYRKSVPEQQRIVSHNLLSSNSSIPTINSPCFVTCYVKQRMLILATVIFA